jgi:hypothetical protein
LRYARTSEHLVKLGGGAHHSKFPTSQYLSSSYPHCSVRRGMARLGRLRRQFNFKNLTSPALHPYLFIHYSKATAFIHVRTGHHHIFHAFSLFWSKFDGSPLEEVHLRVHLSGFARLGPASSQA